MHHPAGCRAVDGMDPADGPARNDLLHLLVVLAIAVLVTDHGFYASVADHLHHLKSFVGGHGDGLFIGNQACARFHAHADHFQPQGWHCTKTEDVGFQPLHQGLGVCGSLWAAEFVCCGIQPLFVNVAKAHNLKPAVICKCLGVVHPPLSESYNNNAVFLVSTHSLKSLPQSLLTDFQVSSAKGQGSLPFRGSCKPSSLRKSRPRTD